MPDRDSGPESEEVIQRMHWSHLEYSGYKYLLETQEGNNWLRIGEFGILAIS